MYNFLFHGFSATTRGFTMGVVLLLLCRDQRYDYLGSQSTFPLKLFSKFIEQGLC